MSSMDPKFLSKIRYRCIGPTRGGRVVAVAADPNRQNIFYFGAVAGGIWRSDDAGLYWENISDGQLATGSVGALEVAPSDPNVIYAGMGESNIRIDVTHGDGLYKSTNAGRTWRHMGLAETRHIGEIRVHPDDPDCVYVAALGHSSKTNPERGVYRSNDGGETWELVLHVSDKAGAVDISLDPNNPRILFATMWQARRTFWSIDSGGTDCGLWRSQDGGDTWEDISRHPGLPDGTLGKMGVAISPALRGRVWAIVEAENRKRGLYRSDDSGDTWIKTSSKPELTWRPWYYMHVVAHPTDPETVFVMDMKAWRSVDGGRNFEQFHTPHGDNHALLIDPTNPDRMIGADDGGAWVSLNGGHSWSTIYNQMTAQFYHVAVDDQFPYYVYGTQQDNSSIAVPSRTYTGAISWSDCYPAGTAESGYIAPKPGDPNTVFVGAIGSSPGGGDCLQKYDHVSKQIQLVNVWPEEYHDGNTAEVRFQWTYPIVFSPHDPDVLYVAGNKVFRSTDEGMSWEVISDDLTHADPDTMGVSGPLTMDTAGAEMYATIFSLMVSAHDDGVLMTGSDDGRVHVTTNGGADWREVTPPDLPQFSQVTMLEESTHREGTVFMTVARHKTGDYAPYVYRTEDLGETWTRIDDGIPEGEFCRVVREDPARPGLLYVGTELGVHVSFDGGVSWQSLQANLPVSPVYDFVIKDHDLVVATHGRSFWILDDLTQLHQMHDELHGADAHLFSPRDTVRTPPHIFADFWGDPGGKNYHVTLGQHATYYQDNLETGHKIKHMIDSGDDIEQGVRVTYYFAEAPEREVTLTFRDADGNEVSSFTNQIPEDKEEDRLYIATGSGMNEFQWPMRYAAGEKMIGTDFHKPPKGPMAPPGRYSVTLASSDWSMTQEFSLVKDPRLETSDADFAEQLELLQRIKAKLDEIVVGVNTCRAMKDQLAAWVGRLADHEEVGTEAEALTEQLDIIERELVQPEFTSEGDSLAHRQMLYEKLQTLVPVIASADTRPTKQSYEVFDKLGGQADEQLARLRDLVDGSLADFNRRLDELDVSIIGV